MRESHQDVPVILALKEVTPAQCEGPLQVAVTINKVIAAVNQLLRRGQLVIDEHGQVVMRERASMSTSMSTGRDENVERLLRATPESAEQYAAFLEWQRANLPAPSDSQPSDSRPADSDLRLQPHIERELEREQRNIPVPSDSEAE